LTTPQEPANVSAIDKQLDALDKQAADAIAETQKLIEKRDKLNEQFRKLRQETRELKAERDCINEKVHALKAQRNEARTTVQPVIEEITAAREKIAELRKKTPKRSQRDLQEELDAIEWKIQTTSFNVEEEKQLMANVKELETQLSAYKKMEKQNKKIAELQQGIHAVDATGEKLHTELSALAQKSQELHQRMLAKIDEAKKTKEEADATHNASLLTREKARQFEEEKRRLAFEGRRIREFERQQRESQRQILAAQRLQERQLRESQHQIEESQRQQETATRKTTEKALKEKLEAQAREKLQRGEKLSWDEFQLLADEDEADAKD
jgi:uncharacterized coiled-coil DUF342 family protein